MIYVFLTLLGLFLIGVVVFGILIPFSLNENSKNDIPSRLGIYVFPKMYRRIYYKPERLWVRKGIIICSIGLFTSLIFMFIFSLNSSEFKFKLKSPEGRGKPPFNLDIN